MADFVQSFNSYLRKNSRKPRTPQAVKCPLCGLDIPDATEPIYARHVRGDHAEILAEFTPNEKTENHKKEGKDDKDRRSGTDVKIRDSVSTPRGGRESVKSPASSLKREGSRSLSPPKRSKARPTPASTPSVPPDVDTVKRPPAQGTLWTPDTEPQRLRLPDRANIAVAHRARVPNQPPRNHPPHGGGGGSAQSAYGPPGEDTTSVLIKQPETRPISQEQLVAEVKGIYAGLIMVETKCIEVDNAQNAQTDNNNKLNHEQWQALIALHRTLLHEHHDFFLASQHPSAAPALRRLATKYAMPARMWRHGIHSFLELLRHRLPASLEHMLTFIYLAYSMMALLYETVPAFEDTWIECLGDLGRYRMAIEDDDIRHREVWTAVSRNWYSKASDKAPTTGRLYHHLAILARPNGFQQLFYYTKSLCVAIQFDSARESIMTLLDPVMALSPHHIARLVPTELEFVRCHGILFSKKFPEKYEASADEFINTLDNFIARNTRRFLEQGYWMGIATCCSIASYGDEKGPIFNAIRNPPTEPAIDQPMADSGMPEEVPTKQLIDAIALANRTHNVILRRFGDTNILPYLHTVMVFMHHLTFLPGAISLVGQDYPWKLTSLMLNTFLDKYTTYARIEGGSFPGPERGENHRPLPEDYAMRGLLWTDRYFPQDWFTYELQDDDEKYMELASFYEERKERLLYIGCQIAAQGGKWLRYDSETHRFSVAPEFDIELEGLSTTQASASVSDLGELPDAAPSEPFSPATP
ncbi:hypothetical protein CONLIGDRAFT_573632 [Coniochaeta ligniaria NRRL 30616]|uniref:DNA/RNA-binding domain-containing protein n=1 Tax=Coniochaeta ligniaria NRRL 30616 TaxID=1408157 RepID=A0A1J7JML1_9PEZI|nr:hypothetical protein CONLIGDRAFT_573632 [Coniochaeta ligniaria NRRL 30616]